MPTGLLPLFPLQVVVFPRVALPLHIFEERYKEMVGQAIREGSEFGIVLARENGIVNAGCTVAVERVVKSYPDGRLDVITRGRRRFEVLELNEDKDYLQGEVEFFDDDEPGPAPVEVTRKALAQYRELVEIGSMDVEKEPDAGDPQLSFQLAQSLRDLEFLDRLLRARSETVRMKQLNEFFSNFLPREREVRRMRSLAPHNGFGGKVPGL
jgi:Lon protease-like protein